MGKSTVRLLIWFFVAVSSAALCSCAKPDEPTTETAAPPPAAQPQPAPAKEPERVSVSGPPNPGEVESAIRRVYEGAVTAYADRFLVGDFDGDSSQDLVAVVKPVAGMLPQINSELARWKLEDPRKVIVPNLRKATTGIPTPPALTPVRADSDDVLLALIHGHGASGWRSPEAMSSYLLKNAVGGQLSAQTLKEARAATSGKNRPFNLRGDVIKQTLGGEKGFIFWTGTVYAWHSLESKRAGS